ncbi:MAG TPA: hypothetical protein VGR57_19520 [Ktedonobacterales bacterium]|nr:hypothetical protein [Ktedonobacterales bacterium]
MAAAKAPATNSELERLEKRMERRWYDLAMAERRSQPEHVLDRMYDAYLRALNDFVTLDQLLTSRRALARLAS